MSGAPDPAVGDGDGPGQVLDTVAWALPYKILLGVVAVLALTFFSLPVVLLLGGMLSAGGADGLPLLLVVPAVLWTAVGVLFAACALRAIGLGMVITTEGVQVRSYRRRRWYPWAGIALVRSRQGWRHLGATELELTDGRTVTVWFTSARYALQRGDRRDPAVWSGGWARVQPLRPTRSAIDAHREWLRRRGAAAGTRPGT